MIKQSQCQYCASFFSYSDSDSKGKFCSRKCHYESKNFMDICKNCGKEFRKRQKDPKKTCSYECYKLRRSSKSSNEVIKERARLVNCLKAGQTSLDTSSSNVTVQESCWMDKYPITKKIKDFVMNIIKK